MSKRERDFVLFFRLLACSGKKDRNQWSEMSCLRWLTTTLFLSKIIVEGEFLLRNALVQKFANEGFSVLEARAGGEGLVVALHKHPEIIVLDIIMPKKVREKLKV